MDMDERDMWAQHAALYDGFVSNCPTEPDRPTARAQVSNIWSQSSAERRRGACKSKSAAVCGGRGTDSEAESETEGEGGACVRLNLLFGLNKMILVLVRGTLRWYGTVDG